ncbi:adenylate/guanylate cyclase domain-containing protein [Hoyosella subflava]|uniref:Putative adenylate cyclase n=1 Tax=Hoyosella subflava (strain DSM 45089 / JCM 17490 / NBRC 109087 / DQS3-9A1) TaxID=443218 RepID=F6EMS5_HOYSD|nr:adenylate/guanylate cyclase domain-containing protein [Hoyosella subflava]AEF42817.1 putative adenylate cyclase [Hoyosella subflava DQS3-9A1]
MPHGDDPHSDHTGEDFFAGAGLLDGLNDKARALRVVALDALICEGVSVDELKSATADGRLPMLILEHALEPPGTLTLADLAEKAAVDEALLRSWFRALGRGVPGDDAPVYNTDDVMVAQQLADYLALGFEFEQLHALARVWGRNLASFIDGLAELVADGLSRAEGDTDVILRYALEVRRFAEVEAQVLGHILGTTLAQRIRSEAVSTANKQNMRIGGTQDVAFCFADLVGFTKLGGQLPAEVLGGVADELSALATELVDPPVRVFKTIGDAVMLMSPDVDAIVAVAVRLVDQAQTRGLPPLRASVTFGKAVPRSGDWYGHPINLASRALSVATAGQVAVTKEVVERLNADGFTIEPLGAFAFKGVDTDTEMFAVWVRSGDAVVPR